MFVIGFAWIEFVDVTTYLNHYWFMTTLGLVMTVAPMDARFALAAVTTRSVRRGWIWLVRVHVAVVYVFAGLAKLNSDWLLHAMPLRLWLPARSDLPFVGPLLEQRSTAYALSWAGAAFDCSVVALAAVATHACVGVGRRRGVPRRDVAAVPDRCVPVVDDRRDDDLLRARLAVTRSPRSCGCGVVDRIPWRPVHRYRQCRIHSERGDSWSPLSGCW